MVLNYFVEGRRVVRSILLGGMVYGALMLAGCGSSEETMTDDEGFQEDTAQQAPEEQKEEASDQQALTSFIGAAPKKEVKKEPTKPEEQPAVQEEAPPPPPSTNPLEELRTENTSLKQKVVKLEQDVRTLNARISDTESKYMAEKDRADRAEEAAKVAAQSAMISARGAARGGQVTADEAPASDIDMGAYEGALGMFGAKKYDDAIASLQALINSGVPATVEDNCHYWIGESNFGKKNYQEALKHFDMVLQYRNSEKLADAHFMMAQCYERTGEKAKAKESYERVVKDFPMSRLVQKAKDRWTRL